MLPAPRNDFSSDEVVSYTRLGKRKRSRSPSPVVSNGLVTQSEYRRLRAWVRSPSVPCIVTPPDVPWRCEMLFAYIPFYVRGSIGAGTWYVNSKGRLRSSKRETISPYNFHNLCSEANTNFNQRLAFKGRRLLSRAFSLLPTLLREAHPASLESLVESLLMVGQTGFVGICAMVQNHIVKLARTILPEQHLWRRICISISYSDPDHTELLTRSWRCLADAYSCASGRFSYGSVSSEVNMTMRLYRSSDPPCVEK